MNVPWGTINRFVVGKRSRSSEPILPVCQSVSELEGLFLVAYRTVLPALLSTTKAWTIGRCCAKLLSRTEAPMRENPQSGPSNPNRRTFLLTTGSSAAATIVERAYLPSRKSARRERLDRAVRTGRTSRARSRSLCASTARTTNFASIRGRRCWIAFVRPLL